MEAAGAYLRTLRDLAGLSQSEVGAAIGVTNDIILRVEKGRGDTRGTGLLKWVAMVGGSHLQLIDILDNPSMTTDEAKVLAQLQYQLGRDGQNHSDYVRANTDAVQLYNTIQRIGVLPTLEGRVEALRQLPLWMFRVIEALAVDLMRATVPRAEE